VSGSERDNSDDTLAQAVPGGQGNRVEAAAVARAVQARGPVDLAAMAGTTAQLDFAQLGTFVIAGDQTWEDAFDAADRCIGGVGRVLPRPRVDSAARSLSARMRQPGLEFSERRLVRDWPERFGHPLLLLETFVDPARPGHDLSGRQLAGAGPNARLSAHPAADAGPP
jgi:hypothetical protein